MRRLLAAVLLATLPLLACKGGDATGHRRGGPIPVRTLALEAESVERVVEVTGTLAGQEEVTLSAEVDAKVEAVHADLGDVVQAGAVLFQLDRRELRLQVAQAESDYQQALARLGIDGADLDRFDPASHAEVRRTLADLEEATRNLARGQTLRTQDLLAQGELDTLRTRERVAEAAHQQALENARSHLAQAKGRRAALGLAQKKLRDTSIRSPIAGAVARRLVSLGEYVRAGQAVAVVVVTHPLKLQAEVPERYAGAIREGMRVEVEVAGGGRHVGTVSRIGPLISGSSRTFPVEALFPNDDGALQPGLFAQGRILLGTEEEVFAFPETALSSIAGVHKVFVHEDGKAVERPVTLLRKRGGDALVQGELATGEELILTAIARLFDGAEVAVDPTPEPAPAARAEPRP